MAKEQKYDKDYKGPDEFLYGNLVANQYSQVSQAVLSAATLYAGYDLYKQNKPLADMLQNITVKGAAATAEAMYQATETLDPKHHEAAKVVLFDKGVAETGKSMLKHLMVSD